MSCSSPCQTTLPTTGISPGDSLKYPAAQLPFDSNYLIPLDITNTDLAEQKISIDEEEQKQNNEMIKITLML